LILKKEVFSPRYGKMHRGKRFEPLFTILRFYCKSIVLGAALFHKSGNKCSTTGARRFPNLLSRDKAN
jgi:hypothetical protein